MFIIGHDASSTGVNERTTAVCSARADFSTGGPHSGSGATGWATALHKGKRSSGANPMMERKGRRFTVFLPESVWRDR